VNVVTVTAVFVAQHGHADFIRDVGAEGEPDIARNAPLNRHLRALIRIAAGERIQRQLRNAGEFLDLGLDLASSLTSDGGFRSGGA